MGRRAVLLVVVVALAACGGGAGGPLFDGGWVLSGVLVDGQPVDVASPSSYRWSLLASGGCDGLGPECPDGPTLRGTDLCNSFTRSIAVDGDTVVWGTYWETTAAACDPPGADPVGDFFRQDSFTYVVDDGEMRATAADGRIVLVFTSGP